MFAVVGLTGPGRIDIEDGQTRFEAGRSLIDHGDTALRDPRVIWSRFPGRDGHEWTYYRFPQIAVAAACTAAADAVGPASEGRRHFAFSLHGAVVAAALVVAYANWFRRRGLGERAALGWAAAGIACTPCWYYATSTFDDILGAAAAVFMLTSAGRARAGGWVSLLMSAAWAAVLFNCKQPLAALVLPAIALADDPQASPTRRLFRAAVLGAGAVIGFGLYAGYHRYKFPVEIEATHAAIIAERYGPNFFGNPLEAAIDYAVGPSAGALWYFPPVLLVLAGLRATPRRVAVAAVVGAAVVVGFLLLLTIYKGGVCWGPRYLTPLFAAGWLVAPDGARRFAPGVVRLLLAAGAAVQLLGLAVVPERLIVERNIPTGFFYVNPWLYLLPQAGHLPNRPREIVSALTADPAPHLTPGPSPTFSMPVMDRPYFDEDKGPAAVAKYRLLCGFRFWWAWLPHVPADERPVPLGATLAGLLAALAAGLLMLAPLSPWGRGAGGEGYTPHPRHATVAHPTSPPPLTPNPSPPRGEGSKRSEAAPC